MSTDIGNTPFSDEKPGPGWWLASDGNWYPPEAQSSRTTPLPQTYKMRQLLKAKQRLIEHAQPLLPPGTQIRQIFEGAQRSPYLLFGLFLLGILPGLVVYLMVNRNRIVAVTGDAIYVLDCGTFVAKPKRVLGVLPRATRFGPVGGPWTKIHIGQASIWSGSIWFPEIAAADAEAAIRSTAAPSIAVFRADAPFSGAAIVFDGSQLLFGGLDGQPVECDVVCQYDQAGYLEWASEEWRQWVWQRATPQATPAPGSA